MAFHLVPGALTLPQLHGFWRQRQAAKLDDRAWQAVAQAEATVAAMVASGKTVYGLNTGFGILAWLTWEKLGLGQDIGGRPLLLLGVLLALMGGQVILTGLIGELLIRIYHEPQGRQLYVLRGPTPPRP